MAENEKEAHLALIACKTRNQLVQMCAAGVQTGTKKPHKCGFL